MNHPDTQPRVWTTADVAKMAVITSLYVVISLLLTPFSFGVVQLRIAELFNYFGVFNKRYIWSITLGVAITNFYSPLGIVDVLVGSVSTFIVLQVCYFVTKRYANPTIKIIVTAIIFSFSMFTVAGQLTIFSGTPFWSTWFVVGLGELLSMTFGGVIVYFINKKVNLFN